MNDKIKKYLYTRNSVSCNIITIYIQVSNEDGRLVINPLLPNRHTIQPLLLIPNHLVLLIKPRKLIRDLHDFTRILDLLATDAHLIFYYPKSRHWSSDCGVEISPLFLIV